MQGCLTCSSAGQQTGHLLFTPCSLARPAKATTAHLTACCSLQLDVLQPTHCLHARSKLSWCLKATAAALQLHKRQLQQQQAPQRRLCRLDQQQLCACQPLCGSSTTEDPAAATTPISLQLCSFDIPLLWYPAGWLLHLAASERAPVPAALAKLYCCLTV